MTRPPIRTLALGLEAAHPLSQQTLAHARNMLIQAQERFEAAGYQVQTVRIVAQPLFEYVQDWSANAILHYIRQIQSYLEELDINYCSFGPLDVSQPSRSLHQIPLIADLLMTAPNLNLTVQIGALNHGVRTEAALPSVEVMRRLATETEGGLGNFRFAVLSCVPSGSPFFPAAYHRGGQSLTLGWQGAGLVAEAIKQARGEQEEPLDLGAITVVVRSSIEREGKLLVSLAQIVAKELGIEFGGLDVSPAPMVEESMGEAIELCGYGKVGAAGTLGVVAALTAALKENSLPRCGYSGIMLPVLEDRVLARRWAEGQLRVHELLSYSSVCGTGLDTIPFAEETPDRVLANLLLDVGTLAVRLRKPLSARFFPVAGGHIGEETAFDSPHLTNTTLLEI